MAILIALVALTSSAAAPVYAAAAPAETAALQMRDGGSAASALAPAHVRFTDADPFTAKGHLNTAQTALQVVAGRDGSHGRVVLRHLRITSFGAALDYTSRAAASRALMATRSSLEFAAALAAARVGTVSSPSTGPPLRLF